MDCSARCAYIPFVLLSFCADGAGESCLRKEKTKTEWFICGILYLNSIERGILMTSFVRRVFAVLLVCCLFAAPVNGLALEKSTNPLLGGLKVEEYAKTQDKFVNILLLGIDYGYEYSDYISCKTDLDECHTDAIVVIAINKTKKTVDLVSIPRDTISYVPGVKGIYKINSAVNCAKNVEKGIRKTVETVSWHLGGIEIDHYVAVDVPAMIALGDAIGGIEYDLEMSYTATSGHYDKGLQVLDGQGIMDYMRARKNATIGGTDLGRTDRLRKMVSAILQKVKSKPSLLFRCIGVLFDDEANIFTDIGFFDAIGLASTALGMDLSAIRTHVLDGKLQGFHSNFNFTDAEARSQMLQEVYGIEVPAEAHSVSSRHMRWLDNEGFETAMSINLAEKVLDSAPMKLFRNAQQKNAYAALEAAHDEAVKAFDAAADGYEGEDRNAMVRAHRALKKEIEASAELLGYTEKLTFKVADAFYEETLLNEYQFNWN